jgi:hypothetical protein
LDSYSIEIYNKGQPLSPELSEKEIHLPKNVGKEGHTYYTYICKNYDRLPDHIIFLQGNPFDHSPNLFENIRNYTNSPSDFAFFSEIIEHTTFQKERDRHWQCVNIYDTYENIIGVKCDITQQCIFGHGAQFAVSKFAILKHPKTFYENIVRILERDENPLEGYDVERLHHTIFVG